MRLSRTFSVICGTLGLAVVTGVTALANFPEQPAVTIKAYNDSDKLSIGKRVIIFQVQREGGMDPAGYQREGPWYIAAGGSTQGIFRRRARDQDGLPVILVKLRTPDNQERTYRIECTRTNEGTYEIYSYGICSVKSGSDDLVRIDTQLIHDNGTSVKPNNLQMLIASFHVMR